MTKNEIFWHLSICLNANKFENLSSKKEKKIIEIEEQGSGSFSFARYMANVFYWEREKYTKALVS